MQTRWISPLRYPGGKVRLHRTLSSLFAQQTNPRLEIEVWIEPFAGGAGAGLKMLHNHSIEQLVLVEKNPAIASFWHHVIHDGEALARRVQTARPTLALFNWARGVLLDTETGTGDHPSDDTAFAAFIVNRLSRSGMITSRVGPIGGKTQEGGWQIGARFNRQELAARINRVYQMRHAITIIEGDAVDVINELRGSGIEDEVMLFVDPPYIVEGPGLYQHGTLSHAALAHALRNCPAPWLLTYDNHRSVPELYPGHRLIEYAIPHTANQQRIGAELAVLSHNLAWPENTSLVEQPRRRSTK